MKHKRAILSLFLLLCMLVSCNALTQYRNDADPEVLVDEALRTLGDGVRYAEDDEDHFEGYFQIPDNVDDVEIRLSTNGSQINEVGILHVNGDPKVLSELVESYLSRTLEERREFYDSYIPNETPKLRDAEVRTFGSYVAYAVLDEPGRNAFFESVRAQLKT